MLSKLLSVFASKQEASKPQRTDHRGLFAIHQQMHDYGDLIALQESTQLLEVLLPEAKESYQSMIIGINFSHNTLEIDELTPKITAPESLIGQTLALRHQRQRDMLLLETTISSWNENTKSYTLSLPTVMPSYQPRRQERRYALNPEELIKTKVVPFYGAPWHGSVVNISMGGMRMLVMGDLRNVLHVNKKLKHCCIDSGEQQPVVRGGTVKAFRYYTRPYRRTEISIAFTAQTSLQEDASLPLSATG